MALPRVQELCESRGGRPGLSVLTSLTVSVDVKQHRTVLRHWSQFVPNVSTDIRGHEALHHQGPWPSTDRAQCTPQQHRFVHRESYEWSVLLASDE